MALRATDMQSTCLYYNEIQAGAANPRHGASPFHAQRPQERQFAAAGDQTRSLRKKVAQYGQPEGAVPSPMRTQRSIPPAGGPPAWVNEDAGEAVPVRPAARLCRRSPRSRGEPKIIVVLPNYAGGLSPGACGPGRPARCPVVPPSPT